MAYLLSKIKGRLPAAKSSKNFPEVKATSYTSQPVDIPDDFLAPLSEASSITVAPIDFANTPLPEYAGHFALVLDNVLSREECAQLIHLTERSTGAHADEPATTGGEGQQQQQAPKTDNGWAPALLNAGLNQEYMATDYRNSDRIIWDEKTVVKRLFDRVLQAEGVRSQIEVLGGEHDPYIVGIDSHALGRQWRLCEHGLNERMRFLRYGPGQFFKAHCDSPFIRDNGERTFLTLHLYLNDSEQALRELKEAGKPVESRTEETCVGGATTFHSRDRKRKLDVDPLAGRILIFQHRLLLHSGAEVSKGTKFTMRSDILYELEKDAES